MNEIKDGEALPTLQREAVPGEDLRANKEQNGMMGLGSFAGLLGKVEDDSFESGEKRLLKIGPLYYYLL